MLKKKKKYSDPPRPSLYTFLCVLDDDEIQDFVKESSANPYKRHIATFKKVPTSANPYMR